MAGNGLWKYIRCVYAKGKKKCEIAYNNNARQNGWF